MSKRAAPHDDQPSAKRARLQGASPASALTDPGAWLILEQFLTTLITYSDTEVAFAAYLGDCHCLNDWTEARLALFSGDGNDALALSNLLELKWKLIPDSASSTIASTSTSAAVVMHPHRSRQPKNLFIDNEADEDEQEQEQDNLELEILAGPSRHVMVMQLPAPNHKFSAAVNRLQDKYTDDMSRSSETYIQNTTYMFHVYRTVTQFVADHLEKQGFSVRESESVDCTNLKLPDPCRVQIKSGKYKGDVAYVFDPDQTNNFVMVLILPRDFLYPMPKGSVMLFDRSRTPANSSTDIIHCGIVVGWSYKVEKYYGGLLKKNVHRYIIEQVYIPYPDDIRLHLQSGFNLSFVKKAKIAYSMQMLDQDGLSSLEAL
ncbi:hypothetical protein EV702DRAFT_1201978 [Suillus placidus]|uniref:Uncharacterized protein n=1 Tax=Suillus placidus TaxID=48579 RepID=A0A9P7CZD8_9AGAM|nr:hypothetical protein EV702DRAFT_1201978 [Suillus placidus]